MEEKKFDINSLIGFVLLGGLMMWYFYMNQPTPEELAKQKIERVQDSIQKVQAEIQKNTPVSEQVVSSPIKATDSLGLIKAQNELGSFAYSSTLASAKDNETTIENELLKIKISNKGGQITQVELKKHKRYDSIPLYLVNVKNATFNINFSTTNNRTLNTKDLFFQPTLTKNGKNQVLSMKLKVSETQFLEYRYEIKPDDYMIDFAIKSQGLNNVINTSQKLELDWSLKAFRQEKSLRTENTYSLLYFKNDEEVDYLSKDANETISNLKWASFKQHFFSSILLTETAFSSAKLSSEDLVKDNDIDTVYTKKYSFTTPLELKSGELNYTMQWYYGPNDYEILKKYKGTDLKDTVDLGWGIFGWINKWLFIPLFGFLTSFIPNYGLVIIIMTIVVRIFMSPMVYKSYLSSARMKVLRPEMEAINDKLKGKENAMKRQQETMALQRKAGVSPLSGCIPALVQMPVFFALFRFFPSNIDLRQKGFLWANDLSSYDTIFEWESHIPLISSLYGNHISLFPILASVAIFFYMRMSQSQQMNMQQPTQEGMPDMQKMMKMMMYFSPIMMLFFFNQYASSLSLYYFISNLLTIGIMLVIKNYVIDEAKIHAQIQENKAKPEKKKSKFRQRLDDAMKQAQDQQAQQKKK